MKVGVYLGTSGIGNAILATPLIAALATKHEVYICGNAEYLGVMSLIKHPEYVKEWLPDPTTTAFDVGIETYMGRLGDAPNVKNRLTFKSYDAVKKLALTMSEAEVNLLHAEALGIIAKPKAYAIPSDRQFPGFDYCIHPGCHPASKNKRWPWFLDLVKRLKGSVAIVGSLEDDAYDWPDNCTEYMDKLNLQDTAALIQSCGMMISNDSGLMHVASALDVPTIGLFGPTSDIKCGPWNSPYGIVRGDEKCQWCWRMDKNKFNKCKDNRCMKSISVDQVLQRVREMRDYVTTRA